MTSPTPGLLHSMGVRRQRVLLDAIGREVGTPVVYLKAAWADPVLYGGRGERVGVDLDVLVSPSAFRAFAKRLEQAGFRRQVHPQHAYSAYAGKDWTFDAPPGFLPVDLHRALAMPPWFHLPGDGPVSRAILYDSIDGPILSLSPEDQVLFLAAHHATHVFDLDDRHLQDTVRLLDEWPVDWRAVTDRAKEAQLSAALQLTTQALASRTDKVPASVLAAQSHRPRLLLLKRLVSGPELRRKLARSAAVDNLLLLPLLSDRIAALPRFLLRYSAHRALDLAARAAEGLTSRSS